MYLKSIEVQGFKSFANKIVFQFHNGITAIVGPNGSGKSNVADAVRWVLGEQRAKQLRGGNMQDVIFSGTENRKPLSYASVAITLDNADHKLPVEFSEVTVTRKIYRSGESEYLINGSTCRLKDIQELFYDTGIGKEGYSIIGQGQIDKILSGKPEERRELFDEAAGIVKYKRRKNTSLKKLDEEQKNLIRVTDILGELEKQYDPLKKQAETAKEYLRLREELKKQDINLFLAETEHLRRELSETQTNLARAEEEFAGAKQAYNEMKEKYAEIEERSEAIEAETEKARRQQNETALLRQQLQGSVELLKEQIHGIRSSDEHYIQRKQAVRQEMESRAAERKRLKEEREALQEEIRIHKEKENSEKEKLTKLQEEMARISFSVEEKKEEIMKLLGNRASTKAQIQHFDTLQEQIRVQKAELAKELLGISQKVEVYRSDYEKYKEEFYSISEKIKDNQEEIRLYEQEIEELQNEIRKGSEKLQTAQKTYHQEFSRLESLKNLTERYDGYGNSIRRVMEQKSVCPGIVGVVADIITVEAQYETAVETALGGNIQNIVTADEETAKTMISYLKKNKYGRATFLPLTSVRTNPFPKPEVLKEDGVIGLAHTLVKTEEKFRELVGNLLGRTVVVDHIDTGIRLARKYHQSIRMVTKEGELLNPGGSMTGGAFRNASNLLGRRREMEELEKKVRVLKKEMDGFENDVERGKKSRAEKYAKVDRMKEELQQYYVVQNTAEMNLRQVQRNQQWIVDQKSVLLNENAKLDEQMKEMKENQDSIQIELGTSEELERKLSEEAEKEQQLLEEKKKEEQQLHEQVEAVQLGFAKLGPKETFLKENEERLRIEYEKFCGELQELEKNRDSAKANILEKENQIAETEKKILDAGDLLEEIQMMTEKLQQEKEQLAQKHRVFLAKREEQTSHISDLDKECFRLSSKKENTEEMLEKQQDYMWEEYEITYNHALAYKDETLTDLGSMKKEVQRLKNEMKNLGNVNVNAIEDFRSLEERYEFLKRQHEDLVEAEATLQKIVRELDAAMRVQFEEQFSRIRSEFNSVFRQLFGGGKGTLELQEGEDLLEAGIRIIAQPPGKKLQNMMQLSGGEKALTAIALLFAIQNLKPSPFCLLDEIEAALDDSNVTRFAQYLHKLTKNTQFIVITHRRGTMTAADRLYGITMQEKGISTLVSVDLLEHQLEK